MVVTAKILTKLLLYSGAKICDTIVWKNTFNKNPMEDVHLKRRVEKSAHSFYGDILKRRRYRIQGLIHAIIFKMGIRPFVRKKGTEYEGVIKHWKKKNIVN